jgi:hypothetical protein
MSEFFKQQQERRVSARKSKANKIKIKLSKKFRGEDDLADSSEEDSEELKNAKMQ